MKKKYLDNLIVLEFAQNNCHPQVITAETALNKYSSLKIDVDKKTWSYGEGNGNLWHRTHFNNMKIGSAKSVEKKDNGLIGVYDRRKTKDLDQMVYDWGEIAHDASRGSVYMD